MEVKMTKKVLLGTLVTFAMVSSLVAAEEYTCNWNTVKMAVDGVDLDWQGETPNLYEKTQVEYAFKNDANFMYVLFRFNDPKKFMSTIAFTGLNVYLDAGGKKKKDYTINFRKKTLTADDFIAKMEAEQGKQLSQEEKDKIRANEYYLDHDIVVTNKKAKSQSLEGVKGLIPAVFRANQNQDGTMMWEIAIPLARGADMAPGIGAAPGQKIKVGFEWGGATQEWKEAQASRMGAQGAQARATQAGDVRSERGASSRLDSNIGLARMRRAMPKKYSFWVDVQLANQQ
jgi:hypothetical protein